MGKIVNVIKATGEIEPFSEEKVISSLMRAGADLPLAQKIVVKIKPSLYPNIPTFEVYSAIMKDLKKEQRTVADKYNLKKAIMDLGPTGYPFEKFVAGVLAAQEYKTKTNQIIMGKCVSHEVDIVAQNDKKYMVECKFHSLPGGRTDIKVALYTYARFLDIKHQGFDSAWLITNTKVTQEVKAYALCMSMRVTAWDYPETDSLNELIDKSGLQPITCLTSLSEEKKKDLIQKGIIYCRDFASHPK